MNPFLVQHHTGVSAVHSGSGKAGEIPLRMLNMSVLSNIQRVYYTDPIFGAAASFLKKEVFKRGISISQRESVYKLKDHAKSITEAHLEGFLAQAIDWLLMFGFFPYKIDVSGPVKLPQIPNFSSGIFLSAINSKLQTKLYFAVKPMYARKTLTLTDKKKFINYIKSTGYQVYTFQGYEVDFELGLPRSSVMKIFHTYSRLEEHKMMSTIAEYNTANPTFFTEKPEQKIDIESFTESQLIGGTHEDFVEDPVTKKRISMEHAFYKKLQDVDRFMKSAQTDAVEVKNLSNEDGKEEIVNRRSGRIHPLPEGHKISTNTNTHNIVQNTSDLEIQYQREVCAVLMVPHTFVFGSERHTGNRVSDANNQGIMETTVERLRNMLEKMYQVIHYNMYWTDISEIFQNDLREITNVRSKVTKNKEDQAALDEIEKRLLEEYQRASFDPDISITFYDDVKIDTDGLKIVIESYKTGVMTQQQAAYLIQKSFGVMTIPESELKEAKVEAPKLMDTENQGIKKRKVEAKEKKEKPEKKKETETKKKEKSKDDQK